MLAKIIMSSKLKTHKGTKKRFRLTATGKAKHRPAGRSHRNVRMDPKRKRKLRHPRVADDSLAEIVRSALGKYSS